jgi:hypothetical protein
MNWIFCSSSLLPFLILNCFYFFSPASAYFLISLIFFSMAYFFPKIFAQGFLAAASFLFNFLNPIVLASIFLIWQRKNLKK